MQKTAIITGGAKRVGAYLALRLAQDGFDIVITYHTSKDSSDELGEKIEALGRRFFAIPLDLTDPKSASSLFACMEKRDMCVSLLINNASDFIKSPIASTSFELLHKQFMLHLFTPYLLTQEFVKHIDSGLVINILDSKIAKNGFRYSAYTLSKKALSDFTLQASMEFAPHFRINAIAPGFVLAPDLPDEGYERLKCANPLNADCAPEDIYQTLIYFLKNECITGQTIYVDGGRHINLGE